VAGEGKENFVEHGGGLCLLYTGISYEYRKFGREGMVRWVWGWFELVEEVVPEQYEGTEDLKAAH
jgi:hypothetical protein